MGVGPTSGNPGDARVNVGSGRESATSDNLAKFGVAEILGFVSLFCARGPSKIGLVIGEFTPTKPLILRWDLALQAVN